MITHTMSGEYKAEEEVIERLRARYEDAGFTFTAHPMATQLPDFLGSYRPDALAQRQGENVAIEVRRQRTPSTERTLQEIRKLIDEHHDWQLHVIFMGSDPLDLIRIPTPTPAAVRGGMQEVRALMAEGHRRPAFLMAWSLLEAALQALNDKSESRPRTPGTTVQTLAMNGYIEPETERRVRGLVDLRNRIAHGDLMAAPSESDVELVLSAIDEALSEGVA